MTRDADITDLQYDSAAATAATDNAGIVAIPASDGHKAFLAQGFYWFWVGSEGNVDNTVDWDISYSANNDAAIDTVVFTNVNPIGLLDTGAANVVFTNRRNPASSGAAAAAASNPADVRIPAATVIRFQIVRAGTGTIPRFVLGIYGHFV